MIDFKQIIGISLNQNKMYSRCKGLKIIKHLYTLKFKIIYTTTIRQDILSLSLVTKSCLTLATPYTIACQAPLSMRFSRQEYWSGLPFPSSGDPPNPGIEPGLLHCRQMLYPLSHQGSPREGPWEAPCVSFPTINKTYDVTIHITPITE